MKKSCLYTFLLLFFLCLSVLFTSCATKQKTEYVTVTETKIETITETEYVPVYVDLNDTIKTVIEQRPDNSTYIILTGDNVKTIWEVMANSWAYQCAWEDWQAYAELLEETLYICRDKCIDPTTTVDVNTDSEEPTSYTYIPSDLTIPVIG